MITANWWVMLIPAIGFGIPALIILWHRHRGEPW